MFHSTRRGWHQVARTLLADGVDPSARKQVLGNQVFAMPKVSPKDAGCAARQLVDRR